MTLSEYQTITGTTVPTANVSRVTAVITRTQRILEDMLGFTLDPALFDDNKYTELGKTPTECPCPDDIDESALDDADAVVFAYRQFTYNKKDKFLVIDPATAIHAVKLVYNDITLKTLEEGDYRLHTKQGLIKYLELTDLCCASLSLCIDCCKNVQLVVDATWVWSDGNIPDDLLQAWAEMVTYYTNLSKDIKSQTMGPHSWTKFNSAKEGPENEARNLSVIKEYAGQHGSVKRINTI